MCLCLLIFFSYVCFGVLRISTILDCSAAVRPSGRWLGLALEARFETPWWSSALNNGRFGFRCQCVALDLAVS